MTSFYWIFLNRKHQIQSPKLSHRRAEKMISQLKREDVRHWWAWNPTFAEWVPLANIIVEEGGRFKLAFQPNREKYGADMSAPGHETEIQGETRTENIFKHEEATKKRQVIHDVQPKPHNVKKVVFEDNHQRAKPDVKPVKQSKPVSGSDPVVFKKVDFSGDDFTWSDAPPMPDLFGEPSDRRNADRFEIRLEVLLMSHGKSFRTHTENISMTGCILENHIPAEFLLKPFEVVFISRQSGAADRLVFKGKIAGSVTDPRRLAFVEQPEESRLKLRALIQRHISGDGQKAG